MEDRRRQEEEQAKLYGRVVARAWQDEAFKGRLLAEPREALAEMGVEVPAGHEVRAVEDTEWVRHLVIPPSSGEELSEEQLDQVAGGEQWFESRPGGTPRCMIVP